MTLLLCLAAAYALILLVVWALARAAARGDRQLDDIHREEKMAERLDRTTMEYVYEQGGKTLRVSASTPKPIRDKLAVEFGREVAWSLGVPRE